MFMHMCKRYGLNYIPHLSLYMNSCHLCVSTADAPVQRPVRGRSMGRQVARSTRSSDSYQLNVSIASTTAMPLRRRLVGSVYVNVAIKSLVICCPILECCCTYTHCTTVCVHPWKHSFLASTAAQMYFQKEMQRRTLDELSFGRGNYLSFFLKKKR